MPKLTTNFYRKLSDMCERLNMAPADMLLIMYTESGLDPSVKGGAAGLTQFVPRTLKQYFKGTPNEFKKLSSSDQLDYIEKYFQDVINTYHPETTAQFYLANLLPATLSLPEIKSKKRNATIAINNSDKTYPGSDLTYGKAYSSNSGLDLNKDGRITYGDIEDHLANKSKDAAYQEALSQFKEVTGKDTGKDTGEESKEEAPDDDSKYSSIITSFIQRIIKEMENLGRSLVASNQNTMLISISSPDVVNNIEFARILSSACEDIYNFKCRTYSDNQNVQILCKTAQTNFNKTYFSTRQLSRALLEEFSLKTNINDIKLHIFTNKKPSYSNLDIKLAESSYRKFIFKMIGNLND